MTEDQDPMIWLHNQAVKAFCNQVAKARFAGLHEQYIEDQKGKVSIHAYCQLAGLNPTEEQIRACVEGKWTLKKINGDLRGIKQAQQAASQPLSGGGPKAVRDHFTPNPLVFGSRGALGGMR